MKKKIFNLLVLSLAGLLLVACGGSEGKETKITDKNGNNVEAQKKTDKKEYTEADLTEFNESVERLIEESNSVVTEIKPDESGDWSKGIDVTVINDVRDYSEEEKMQIANDYGFSMAGKARGLLYGADDEVKPFVTVYYQSGDVMARHDVLMKKMVLEN